jgi:hypothetical protein
MLVRIIYLKINQLSSSCRLPFMNIIYRGIYGSEGTSRIPGHVNVITPVRVDMPQNSDIINPSWI